MKLSEQILERVAPSESVDRRDPVGWIEHNLGIELWSRQREIVESVRDNRHTGVQSAHGIGKSLVSAAIATWWVAVHPVGSAIVVTTAPTSAQLEAILWREIGRCHRRGQLAGRITGGMVPKWTISGTLVAQGRKPQDLTDPEQAAAAFSGIHAQHVLVIADEAAGIPAWLWDAMDTLTTTESARLLAIGNPLDPQSQFAKVCRPGSGWNVIQISAFDSPAFTGEVVRAGLLEMLTSRRWVEERAQRWGEGSPLYVSRVLGEFPEAGEDVLISPALVRAAQERELEPDGPTRYGVDVARSGNDETVAYSNRSGVIRRVLATRGEDTMRTTGRVARLLKADEGSEAVIDATGLGAGVFDRLREQSLPAEAFQSASKSHKPEKFANRRAEAFWVLREELEAGRIDLDPADDELASQLLSLRWHLDSKGRILIESKEQMRKRGLRSPDHADAVAMSMPPDRPVFFMRWGSQQQSIYDQLHGPPPSELDRRLGPAPTTKQILEMEW